MIASKKFRTRHIFRTKPYMNKQYKMPHNLRTLEEIHGSLNKALEVVLPHLDSKSKTHTIFMYWIPQLCTTVNTKLDLKDIENDLSFLLRLSKYSESIDANDVFISGIKLDDGTILPTGSCFVLLQNYLFSAISKTELEMLIFESGLHITIVSLIMLRNHVKGKPMLIFDENSQPINQDASKLETNFIKLSKGTMKELLKETESLKCSYILFQMKHMSVTTHEVPEAILPLCDSNFYYIFKGTSEFSCNLIILATPVKKTQHFNLPKNFPHPEPEKTELNLAKIPHCNSCRQIALNDARSYLLDPRMQFTVYDNQHLQLILHKFSQTNGSSRSQETFSKKESRRNRKNANLKPNPSSGNPNQNLRPAQKSRNTGTKSFEDNLLSRMRDHDERTDFVTQKLPNLLQNGNTVVKIENLPANITTQSLNMMLGTYTLTSSQIVGIVASNGSKQKNTSGLMNVRIVLESNCEDLPKILQKNQLKTPDNFDLRVKKTDVKDLEKFLFTNSHKILAVD